MTTSQIIKTPEILKPKLAWRRILWFIIALTLGVLAGWLAQPWIHGNEEARTMVVRIFSIFAGFLITIMTIVGEPSFYTGLNWRGIAVRRDAIFPKLHRHQTLFLCYMAVLGLVFVTSAIIKKHPEHHMVIWFERGYIGFATFAFILSLGLPRQLIRQQMDRYEELLDRAKDNNPPPAA